MAHYITIIANIFHIYAVYQFSQLLFQKKPNRKLLEFILYFLYFQINSFCFVYFHSIIWNVLSNLIPFFCITLFYPTTWSHRILSVFSIYIVSMAIDILCATVSIWFDYTLFFTSGFAAALLLLIVARIAAHFKLYRKEVVPRVYFTLSTFSLFPWAVSFWRTTLPGRSPGARSSQPSSCCF